jgi:hypothetical protein
MSHGLSLLETDQNLLRSFTMMNEAMSFAYRGRYLGWRPFQIGFLLANLASILGEEDETSVVDILWFATGGGKTETYLGLLLMGGCFVSLGLLISSTTNGSGSSAIRWVHSRSVAWAEAREGEPSLV